MLLGGLQRPLVVSVHTGVKFDFRHQPMPGLAQPPYLSPYFVRPALFIRVAIDGYHSRDPLRAKWVHWKDLITTRPPGRNG